MFIIVDHRIKSSSLSSLKALGFEPILMPSLPLLQQGVSAHADMLIFMGLGKLFCHRSYYADKKVLIDRIVGISGLDLIISDEILSSDYPHDVLFNAALIGRRLVCNKKTISRHILKAAEESGCTVINVSQGYTKCSVCAVSDNAIITADKVIASACEVESIDVLLIDEGHVSLPPYNSGFIGGTCGVHGDNVYFCGTLDTHPDAGRIKEFCKKHQKNTVSLSNGELQDVGSLFFI